MEWLILTKIVVTLTLKAANIVIHSIGIHLLRGLQKNGRGDENMIYITSLSIAELLMNIISFARNLVKIIPNPLFKSDTFEDIVMYSYIADYTVLKFSLFMSMVIMSVDRMFLVVLNISYPLFWNRKKAKICMWFIWIAGIVTFIVASVFYSSAEAIFHNDDARLNSTNVSVEDIGNSTPGYHTHVSKEFIDNFFFLANNTAIFFNLVFVTTAVMSYGIIFHIFKQRHGTSKESVWEVFRKSRFYVPLLIISSNILFILPPDFIWTFVKNPNKVLQLLTSSSYAVAYLSDGLLYIFMNDKVRKALFKKVRKVARNHDNSRSIFIRKIVVTVEKKIPTTNKDSMYSHSENSTVYHDNNMVLNRERPHPGDSIAAVSVMSIEQSGIGVKV